MRSNRPWIWPAGEWPRPRRWPTSWANTWSKLLQAMSGSKPPRSHRSTAPYRRVPGSPGHGAGGIHLGGDAALRLDPLARDAHVPGGLQPPLLQVGRHPGGGGMDDRVETAAYARNMDLDVRRGRIQDVGPHLHQRKASLPATSGTVPSGVWTAWVSQRCGMERLRGLAPGVTVNVGAAVAPPSLVRVSGPVVAPSGTITKAEVAMENPKPSRVTTVPPCPPED